MKHSSLASALWVSGAALLFSACGGDESIPGGSNIKDPVELCKAIAAKECARIYECFDPTVLAAVNAPKTKEECTAQGQELLGCATATADKVCAGAKPWPLDVGNKCMGEAEAATCAQIRDNLANISKYAPSCGQCFPLTF